MIPPLSTTRRARVLLQGALAFVCIWLLTAWIWIAPLPSKAAGAAVQAQDRHAQAPDPVEFWRQLQPLIHDHEPRCGPLQRLGSAEAKGFEPAEPMVRPDLVTMTAQDLLRMKQAHAGFVDALDAHAPPMPYMPKTRGVVTTADGALLPVMVISLRMLRRTGSTLPVEVFVQRPDEWESAMCDDVLPALNARCVILSDVLAAAPGPIKVEKYQLKVLAMILSSFEEVLFLDADSFPLDRPETLFAEEPFRSTNMVTWPDFWASSASPLYYEIASQPVPPMDARQSTESGQLLVSKRTHARTLLLCAYYNFWGPDHYYRLLTQGGPGEGDKETFLAAAAAMGEPFYQVSASVAAMGLVTRNGFRGNTMMQFHAVDDFGMTQGGRRRVNGSSVPAPRPLFVHANYPKFNPASVFYQQGDDSPPVDAGGKYRRVWTAPESVVEAMGPGAEKGFWAEIRWTACELETSFRSWQGQTGICSRVDEYWRAMYGDEDPAEVP